MTGTLAPSAREARPGAAVPLDVSPPLRFTVITPAYNAAPFIREAVTSALAQTYPLHELIVVDDGSVDGTLESLDGIDDPRLQLVRQPHAGVGRARNVGLQRATGDVICFLDADDRWLPGRLEYEARVYLSEPEVGGVFLDFLRFDERGTLPGTEFGYTPEVRRLRSRPAAVPGARVVEGDAFRQLVSFRQLPGWAGASSFRAHVLRDLRFDESLVRCQDLHLCMRAWRRTRMAFITEPLVQVRLHGANATADTARMPTAVAAALHALPADGLKRAQRVALSRRIAWQYVALGTAAGRNGDVGRALSQFAHALRRGRRLPSLGKQLLLLPLHVARFHLARRSHRRELARHLAGDRAAQPQPSSRASSRTHLSMRS